jgi:hypothetical protein
MAMVDSGIAAAKIWKIAWGFERRKGSQNARLIHVFS